MNCITQWSSFKYFALFYHNSFFHHVILHNLFFRCKTESEYICKTKRKTSYFCLIDRNINITEKSSLFFKAKVFYSQLVRQSRVHRALSIELHFISKIKTLTVLCQWQKLAHWSIWSSIHLSKECCITDEKGSSFTKITRRNSIRNARAKLRDLATCTLTNIIQLPHYLHKNKPCHDQPHETESTRK